MKIILITALALSLLIITACSSDNDSGNSVSPIIQLEEIKSKGCINIEKLTNLVNGKFNFPYRSTTANFSTSGNLRSLEIRNFGIMEGTLTHFPHLREPKQEACNYVVMASQFGQPTKYDIVNTSKNSIKLQLSEDQENELEGTRREAHVESLELETIEYIFTSEQSAIVLTKGMMQLHRCDKKTNFQKKSILRWAPSLSSLPNTERLDPDYRLKYAEVLDNTVNPPSEPPADASGPVALNIMYQSDEDVQGDSILKIKNAQQILYRELQANQCN